MEAVAYEQHLAVEAEIRYTFSKYGEWSLSAQDGKPVSASSVRDKGVEVWYHDIGSSRVSTVCLDHLM